MRRFLRPGIGFAVVAYVGFGFLGDAPDTRASNAVVARWFLDHTNGVYACAFLESVAVVLLLWAAASVAERLRAQRQGQAAVVVTAAAGVLAVLLLLLALLYTALAYVVAEEASGSSKALFELTLVATSVIAVPGAALVGAAVAGGRRAGVVSARLTAAGILSVVVLLAMAAGFADHGLFSPDVDQQIVLPLVLVWAATLDVYLSRRVHLSP